MSHLTFYDALNEVLATSRYDALTGRRVNLGERLQEWLAETINNFFSNLSLGEQAPTLTYNLDLIALAFVAIGAILIVVTAIVLYHAYKGRQRTQHHDLSDIFEELTRKDYSVAELINLSDNADNLRLAIRYRYIAALLSLNERQIIDIKPFATTALILQQVQTSTPTLLAAFTCTADVFQRAWFGYKHIDDEAYTNFVRAVDSLVVYHE